MAALRNGIKIFRAVPKPRQFKPYSIPLSSKINDNNVIATNQNHCNTQNKNIIRQNIKKKSYFKDYKIKMIARVTNINRDSRYDEHTKRQNMPEMVISLADLKLWETSMKNLFWVVKNFFNEIEDQMLTCLSMKDENNNNNNNQNQTSMVLNKSDLVVAGKLLTQENKLNINKRIGVDDTDTNKNKNDENITTTTQKQQLAIQEKCKQQTYVFDPLFKRGEILTNENITSSFNIIKKQNSTTDCSKITTTTKLESERGNDNKRTTGKIKKADTSQKEKYFMNDEPTFSDQTTHNEFLVSLTPVVKNNKSQLNGENGIGCDTKSKILQENNYRSFNMKRIPISNTYDNKTIMKVFYNKITNGNLLNRSKSITGLLFSKENNFNTTQRLFNDGGGGKMYKSDKITVSETNVALKSQSNEHNAVNIKLKKSKNNTIKMAKTKSDLKLSKNGYSLNRPIKSFTHLKSNSDNCTNGSNIKLYEQQPNSILKLPLEKTKFTVQLNESIRLLNILSKTIKQKNNELTDQKIKDLKDGIKENESESDKQKKMEGEKTYMELVKISLSNEENLSPEDDLEVLMLSPLENYNDIQNNKTLLLLNEVNENAAENRQTTDVKSIYKATVMDIIPDDDDGDNILEGGRKDRPIIITPTDTSETENTTVYSIYKSRPKLMKVKVENIKDGSFSLKEAERKVTIKHVANKESGNNEIDKKDNISAKTEIVNKCEKTNEEEEEDPLKDWPQLLPSIKQSVPEHMIGIRNRDEIKNLNKQNEMFKLNSTPTGDKILENLASQTKENKSTQLETSSEHKNLFNNALANQMQSSKNKFSLIKTSLSKTQLFSEKTVDIVKSQTYETKQIVKQDEKSNNEMININNKTTENTKNMFDIANYITKFNPFSTVKDIFPNRLLKKSFSHDALLENTTIAKELITSLVKMYNTFSDNIKNSVKETNNMLTVSSGTLKRSLSSIFQTDDEIKSMRPIKLLEGQSIIKEKLTETTKKEVKQKSQEDGNDTTGGEKQQINNEIKPPATTPGREENHTVRITTQSTPLAIERQLNERKGKESKMDKYKGEDLFEQKIKLKKQSLNNTEKHGYNDYLERIKLKNNELADGKSNHNMEKEINMKNEIVNFYRGLPQNTRTISTLKRLPGKISDVNEMPSQTEIRTVDNNTVTPVNRLSEHEMRLQKRIETIRKEIANRAEKLTGSTFNTKLMLEKQTEQTMPPIRIRIGTREINPQNDNTISSKRMIRLKSDTSRNVSEYVGMAAAYTNLINKSSNENANKKIPVYNYKPSKGIETDGLTSLSPMNFTQRSKKLRNQPNIIDPLIFYTGSHANKLQKSKSATKQIIKSQSIISNTREMDVKGSSHKIFNVNKMITVNQLRDENKFRITKLKSIKSNPGIKTNKETAGRKQSQSSFTPINRMTTPNNSKMWPMNVVTDRPLPSKLGMANSLVAEKVNKSDTKNDTFRETATKIELQRIFRNKKPPVKEHRYYPQMDDKKLENMKISANNSERNLNRNFEPQHIYRTESRIRRQKENIRIPISSSVQSENAILKMIKPKGIQSKIMRSEFKSPAKLRTEKENVKGQTVKPYEGAHYKADLHGTKKLQAHKRTGLNEDISRYINEDRRTISITDMNTSMIGDTQKDNKMNSAKLMLVNNDREELYSGNDKKKYLDRIRKKLSNNSITVAANENRSKLKSEKKIIIKNAPQPVPRNLSSNKSTIPMNITDSLFPHVKISKTESYSMLTNSGNKNYYLKSYSDHNSKRLNTIIKKRHFHQLTANQNSENDTMTHASRNAVNFNENEGRNMLPIKKHMRSLDNRNGKEQKFNVKDCHSTKNYLSHTSIQISKLKETDFKEGEEEENETAKKKKHSLYKKPIGKPPNEKNHRLYTNNRKPNTSKSDTKMTKIVTISTATMSANSLLQKSTSLTKLMSVTKSIPKLLNLNKLTAANNKQLNDTTSAQNPILIK